MAGITLISWEHEYNFMDSYHSIFVSVDWLHENMDNDSLVIVDCRYDLMDPAKAIRRYGEGHIPRSFRMDMERDLSGQKAEHGGRHPFPEPDRLLKILRSMGINNDTLVIGYDDDLSGASRLWFVLRYYGHGSVRIMDGGISEWIRKGYPLTTVSPRASRNGNIVFGNGSEAIIDSFSLKGHLKELKIVDSRSRPRYLGEFEPIDSRAGHIPGAANIDYLSVQEKPGKIKSAEELREIYSGLGNRPVVYCGSGVTSCVNYVAMKSIGLDPILYAGSWSDWISYPDNPVSTGSDRYD